MFLSPATLTLTTFIPRKLIPRWEKIETVSALERPGRQPLVRNWATVSSSFLVSSVVMAGCSSSPLSSRMFANLKEERTNNNGQGKKQTSANFPKIIFQICELFIFFRRTEINSREWIARCLISIATLNALTYSCKGKSFCWRAQHFCRRQSR